MGLTTHALTEISDLGNLYVVMRISKTATVYTKLCYYMENSILVAKATTLDDERMSRHTVSTVCTYVPNMKRES